MREYNKFYLCILLFNSVGARGFWMYDQCRRMQTWAPTLGAFGTAGALLAIFDRSYRIVPVYAFSATCMALYMTKYFAGSPRSAQRGRRLLPVPAETTMRCRFTHCPQEHTQLTQEMEALRLHCKSLELINDTLNRKCGELESRDQHQQTDFQKKCDHVRELEGKDKIIGILRQKLELAEAQLGVWRS